MQLDDRSLYIGTHKGLVIAREEGRGIKVEAKVLSGQHVTSVIAREGVVLAATRQGIFRSEDGGRQWGEASNGLRISYVRWLTYHPEISDLEFAGTEPASIYVSKNGADSWTEHQEVSELRDRFKWYLPYSPRAGCVRGFSFHGQRGYAAVEVGGVLVTDDVGETWRLAAGSSGKPQLGAPPNGQIHPDVHSIGVHRSSPDLVTVATGGGLYRSADGGTRWSLLYDCYCRACWVDEADSDHLILGPADNVDENGRIEESHDGGRTWQSASAGLLVPWPEHMVGRFVQIAATLFAVLSNGELVSSPLGSLQWMTVLPAETGVTSLSAMGN